MSKQYRGYYIYKSNNKIDPYQVRKYVNRVSVILARCPTFYEAQTAIDRIIYQEKEIKNGK